MMNGLRPLHDCVLIRRSAAEERSPGGTIIPDTEKEKPVEGEVLAFGAVARDETGRVVPMASRSATACCSATEVIIGGEERLVTIRAPL